MPVIHPVWVHKSLKRLICCNSISGEQLHLQQKLEWIDLRFPGGHGDTMPSFHFVDGETKVDEIFWAASFAKTVGQRNG